MSERGPQEDPVRQLRDISGETRLRRLQEASIDVVDDYKMPRKTQLGLALSHLGNLIRAAGGPVRTKRGG